MYNIYKNMDVYAFLSSISGWLCKIEKQKC